MPRFVDEEQIAAVVKILSLEVLRPELQLDLVIAYLTDVHCSLAQVHRDLLRWPEGQYHGFGRLGHRGRLDHHSGTCQLLCLFTTCGKACEAEDQHRQHACAHHRAAPYQFHTPTPSNLYRPSVLSVDREIGNFDRDDPT